MPPPEDDPPNGKTRSPGHRRSLVHRIFDHLRATTVRAGVFVTRFNRLIQYLLHLLVWSRIFAGRRGIAPIELPSEVLGKKGVRNRPPRFAMRSGDAAIDAIFRDGFSEVYAVLFANLHGNRLRTSYRFGTPGPAFNGIYLWDSAFIAQVWRLWEPTVARECLQAVVDVRDGDRLQHMVSDFAKSPFSQPPLIAWSLVELLKGGELEATRDLTGEILPLYEALGAYQEWLEVNRRLPGGLYFWEHCYESGVENAPRFSSRDEHRLEPTRSRAAPDLCSYVVLQFEALEWLARFLGRPEDSADYRRRGDELRQRVRESLWDDCWGVFLDWDTEAKAFVRKETIASLIPLWAGIPDRQQAERLVDRIFSPQGYRTRIPLGSVPVDGEGFDLDMWRGPVWINTAYAVIEGLERYGFGAEAASLTADLCEGVYRVFAEEGRIYEFYDPHEWHTRNLSRKRGNRWKQLTLGSGPQKDFVGWTGLVNTLWVERVLGLRERSGGFVLVPRIPERMTGAKLELELPRSGIHLSLERQKDGMHLGQLRRGNRELRFGLPPEGTFCFDGQLEPKETTDA